MRGMYVSVTPCSCLRLARERRLAHEIDFADRNGGVHWQEQAYSLTRPQDTCVLDTDGDAWLDDVEEEEDVVG